MTFINNTPEMLARTGGRPIQQKACNECRRSRTKVCFPSSAIEKIYETHEEFSIDLVRAERWISVPKLLEQEYAVYR